MPGLSPPDELVDRLHGCGFAALRVDTVLAASVKALSVLFMTIVARIDLSLLLSALICAWSRQSSSTDRLALIVDACFLFEPFEAFVVDLDAVLRGFDFVGDGGNK